VNLSNLSKAQRALLVEIHQAKRAASARLTFSVSGKRLQTAQNLAAKGFLKPLAPGYRPDVELTPAGSLAAYRALQAPGLRRRAIGRLR